MTSGRNTLRTLDELPVEGRHVFCRVDLNVPLSEGKVADDTRIRAILPTLKILMERGAKIVLASHLGRPKGKADPKYSLLPVGQYLAELLGKPVIFPDDCIGDGVRKIQKDQRAGEIVLLENLRYHAEEEANDPLFAEQLKGQTDLYISDAFGSLHRAHASTAALPRLYADRGVGLLVAKELEFLAPLLDAPARPFVVVLGGAKVSDKIKVIEYLIRRVDRLLIGGAMAFTFLRAMGRKTGLSLVEEDRIPHALRFLEEARAKGVEIVLPVDVALGRSFDNPGAPVMADASDIPDGWMGLDVGPKTIELFRNHLLRARTIFWNGPLGLFEKPPFDAGTVAVAKVLSETSATTVIGGGDSAAAVHQAGVAEKMSHISTGGGATLEYLEGLGLPGLEALSV